MSLGSLVSICPQKRVCTALASFGGLDFVGYSYYGVVMIAIIVIALTMYLIVVTPANR